MKEKKLYNRELITDAIRAHGLRGFARICQLSARTLDKAQSGADLKATTLHAIAQGLEVPICTLMDCDDSSISYKKPTAK